jgi:glycosyltransferase involved in cell wall biosynthesis
MRVAIFCNDYWPTIGGVQTAVRGIAAGLRARGSEALVLTRQPGGAPAEEMLEGSRIRRFTWNLVPAASFAPRALRARREVRDAVLGWRPDAMYAHFVSVHALFAWDCARVADVPLLLSFRGNDVVRIAPRSVLTRRTYAALTRAADANLFCSPWLMQQALGASWFRGRADRVGVLADAVDVSGRMAFANPAGERFVIAGGRMVHKKGFDLLLRAWASIGDRVEATLWIAGDGPEAGDLRALASSLGLDGKVRFLGPVPHGELLGMVAQAALCVVPSREEPYGIFVLEAQALRTPVLATAVGNLPALIEHGTTGYLAPATAEGLADGILAAWCDPNRARVGSAGKHAPGARRGYEALAAELEGWIDRTRSPAAKGAAWS